MVYPTSATRSSSRRADRRWSLSRWTVLELLSQFGEPIPDVTPVEFDIGFTRARTLPSSAAAGRLPDTRGDVFQTRHLDLELGLPAFGVAVKNFDDDACAVEHARARRTLQIADLARRQFVIDDHVVWPLRSIGIIGREVFRLRVAGLSLEFGAGLRCRSGRERANRSAAAGQFRQFRQLSLSKHECAACPLPFLAERAGDLEAERLDQPRKFPEARCVGNVVDFRKLDAHEHGAWNGYFSFNHLPSLAQRSAVMRQDVKKLSL